MINSFIQLELENDKVLYLFFTLNQSSILFFIFFNTEITELLQNSSKQKHKAILLCVCSCVHRCVSACVCVCWGGWGACMHVCVCRHTGMDVITACTNVSTCVILVSAQSVCTYISYQHVTCRKPKFPIK